MMGPGLLRFIRLRTDMLMDRLYRRLTDEEDMEPCPPPVLNTPALPPRLPSPPPPGPREGAAAPSRGEPNSMVLATRKLTMIEPGPRPKLRGKILSPGVGLGSSKPYLVRIKPSLFVSAGMPGRP